MTSHWDENPIDGWSFPVLIPGADTCLPPVASPVAVDGGRVSVHRQPSARGVRSAHTSPPDALGKSSGGDDGGGPSTSLLGSPPHRPPPRALVRGARRVTTDTRTNGQRSTA